MKTVMKIVINTRHKTCRRRVKWQQTVTERASFLRFLTEPEPVLVKKWDDLRYFCSLMFVMPAIVGVTHWIWDYVTDPIGAHNTVWLRLLFLSSLSFPFAFLIFASVSIVKALRCGENW